MQRFHLIELHEQPWVPASWRRIFQDSLGTMITTYRAYGGVVAPLARLLQKTDAQAVLDLCSGSAEPIVDLCRRAATHAGRPQPVVWLSDLYPNLEHYARLKADNPGRINYFDQPLDARAIPQDAGLPKVRTICTALHHFRPEEARALLQGAVEGADGIAVFEAQDRTADSLFSMLGVWAGMAVITPFCLRPWRPLQLLLGLLFPIIPLAGFFDGVVSCLRSYHPQELQAMAESLDAPGFVWESGRAPIMGGMAHAVYLIGYRQ